MDASNLKAGSKTAEYRPTRTRSHCRQHNLLPPQAFPSLNERATHGAARSAAIHVQTGTLHVIGQAAASGYKQQRIGCA
jgi:hypothetical protein